MKQRKWIAILMSALLSLCLAFLGLFGALELTLFRSGYLIQCMDQTEYISEITNIIRSTCQSYASAAGLNAHVIDDYIQPDDVRFETHRAVAERYRGSEAAFYQEHFAGLADSLRASLTPEELAIETETSLMRFSVLQALCDNTLREVTRPPFDAALSTVLQYHVYRMWVYLTLLILLCGVCLVLSRAVPDKASFLHGASLALMGAALTLIATAALLRWAMPYRSWMPAENLAYPVFCAWWGGFSVVLAILGMLCLAAGLLWAVWNTRRVPRTVAAAAYASAATGASAPDNTAGVPSPTVTDAPAANAAEIEARKTMNRPIDLSKASRRSLNEPKQ